MKRLILSTILVGIFFVGAYFYLDRLGNNVEEAGDNIDEPTIRGGNATSSENGAEAISAVIETDVGSIEVELYPAIAPKTVENFTKLAKENFYNGVKFHRVVPGFVIQAGDPLSKTDDPRTGTGGPGYIFEDEINPRELGLSEDLIKQLETQGYKYNYDLKSMPVNTGTIAMANSGPNTNGSQFFIVTDKNQPHLNGKHTVFGKVIRGMDIVLNIRQGDKIKTIDVAESEMEKEEE